MTRQTPCTDENSSFVFKLWQILQNPNFTHIVSWNTAGDTVQIRNELALENQLLPLYFRHAKVKSFVRQLNMYGFRKVRKQKDNLEFFNRQFLRDSPPQLTLIHRRISKRPKKNASPASRQEKQESSKNPIREASIVGTSKMEEDPDFEPESYQPPRVRSNVHFREDYEGEMRILPLHSFASNHDEVKMSGEMLRSSGYFSKAVLNSKSNTADSGLGWNSFVVSCEYLI